MTKIDIISGFLGAGKTTLIRKLLKEAFAGEKIVLIENEFGEIGIDGGFLKDSGVEIHEMNSGCICCSLVGDFGKALEEVLTTYTPDRVVIEPSGVGKLSDVMEAVRNVAKNLEVDINSAVTVVDATKCKLYMKNFGEFFNNQIEHAGTIILSRTDVADKERLQTAVEMIRSHNPHAVLVTTPIAQLEGGKLLETMERPDEMMNVLLEEVKEEHGHHHEHGEGCGCGGHHHDHEHGEGCGCGGHGHDHEHGEGCGCGGHGHDHEHGEGCGCGGHGHGHEHEHGHHHADEVFASWGLETIIPCDREELEGILDEMAYGNAYGDVLRAKGMIPSENPSEWYYFDLVPEEFEIRVGKPDYTGKVCVIGANLKEEQLNRAFGRS